MKLKRRLTLALLALSATVFSFSLVACGGGGGADASDCAKNGHTLGRYFGESSATCTDSGFSLAVCAICEEMYETKMPALGHKEAIQKGQEATCTLNGKTDKVYCERCDEVLTPSTTIPAGHTLGEVKYIYPSYRQYEGYVEFWCGRNCTNSYGQKVMYTNSEHPDGRFPLPLLNSDKYTVEVEGEDTFYSIEVLGKTVEFTVSNFETNYFGSNGVGIYKYNGTTANLVIPATFEGLTVQSIGENAFKNNTTLETIVIPSTVKQINASAFEGCTALKSIVIPEGCTVIDDNAFKGCTSLTSVTIPTTMQYIYQEAFKNCTSLEAVSFPENLYFLGNSAFEGCASLKNVVIPFKTEINAYGFRNCTSLETIVLPKNDYAICFLQGCNNLKKLTIQSCSVDICMFFTNSQSYVRKDVIPASLKEIIITGANEYDTGILYSYEGFNNIEKVTILSCTAIPASTFRDCTSLQYISIPSDVEEVNSFAFSGCTSLATTTYENGKYVGNEDSPYLVLVDFVAPATECEFTVNANTKFVQPPYTFWTAFTAFNFSKNVKQIASNLNAETPTIKYGGTAGEWMLVDLSGSNFSSCTIIFGDGTTPADVTHLVLEEGMEYLFRDQLTGYNLTAITLPSTLTYIEYNTFVKRPDLKTLYLKGEQELFETLMACHVELFKGFETVYFYDGEEYYEPTYVKLTLGSVVNLNGLTKLEKLILPKSVSLDKNGTMFDALLGKVDLYYLGTTTEWNSKTNHDKIDAKFNVYCYSEEEQTLNSYLSNPVKLWHYDTNGEPTPWVKAGNSLAGKTYNYSTTTVEVSDTYWYMLKEAEAQGMLNMLFETQLEIEMITSSNTKEEYETKLANFSKLAGSNMTISFASGVMTVNKDGSAAFNYFEINGLVYVRAGLSYAVYATIVDANTIVEGVSDEYVTIKHVWVKAN